MLFLFIILTGTLASATSLNLVANLHKRQDAFVPDTTPVESCPTGWVECGNDCILPSRGDVCCSENYGCPTGSFCLTQGYCCPDGEDPSTCAVNNGVSLSAGFNTAPISGSLPASSSTAPTTAAGTITSSASEALVTTSSASGAVSTASSSIYSPSSSTYSIAGTTGFSNYTAKPTNTVVPFTGAANLGQVAVGFVGAAAGVAAWGML